MSEDSESGITGSKQSSEGQQEAAETSSQNLNNSAEDDNDICSSQPLNMEDINNIIGVQSDVNSESTLESEIDALSKIITDTKEEFQTDDLKSDFDLKISDIFDPMENKKFTCDMKESQVKDEVSTIAKLQEQELVASKNFINY